MENFVSPYDARSLVSLLMERLGRGEGGYAEAAGGGGTLSARSSSSSESE